ncbi:MAG: NAD-binding protein, partial [Alphaproteobacteria bacterium]|nr:NAD-binding protein [Alphaproteobacteria bacterium]
MEANLASTGHSPYELVAALDGTARVDVREGVIHGFNLDAVSAKQGRSGGALGLAYAVRAGLDTGRVLEAVGGGAAASAILSHLGPKMVKGDFAPGFMVEHFVKDLGIAREESVRLGLDLPVLALVHELYRKLAQDGGGGDGTQSLFRLHSAQSL